MPFLTSNYARPMNSLLHLWPCFITPCIIDPQWSQKVGVVYVASSHWWLRWSACCARPITAAVVLGSCHQSQFPVLFCLMHLFVLITRIKKREKIDVIFCYSNTRPVGISAINMIVFSKWRHVDPRPEPLQHLNAIHNASESVRTSKTYDNIKTNWS